MTNQLGSSAAFSELLVAKQGGSLTSPSVSGTIVSLITGLKVEGGGPFSVPIVSSTSLPNAVYYAARS